MRRNVQNSGRIAAEIKFPETASGQQIALSFDASLLELYATFQSVVRAAVTMSGKQEKVIAADCGMSPQEFTRRLNENPNDPGHPFPISALDDLFGSIDPSMPIEWLVLKYLQSPEVRKSQAIATIARASRALECALAALKDTE